MLQKYLSDTSAIARIVLCCCCCCCCGSTWHGGISILTALSNTGRPDHGYLQLRQSGLLTPYTARGHLLVFPEFSKFPNFFALRRDRFLYLGWADGRCISVSVVGVCFLRFNYPIVIVVSFQCQNKRKKCV